MREYENKLLEIQLENVDLDMKEDQVNQLIAQHEEKRLTIEQLSDDSLKHIPYQSLSQISPLDLKKDLMETTNWHLYYKKLSQIREFTRGRSTWSYFNQVFMISAKRNHGIAAIRVSSTNEKKNLFDSFIFHSDTFSLGQNQRHGCFIEILSLINTLRKSLKCAFEKKCWNICQRKFPTTTWWSESMRKIELKWWTSFYLGERTMGTRWERCFEHRFHYLSSYETS